MEFSEVGLLFVDDHSDEEPTFVVKRQKVSGVRFLLVNPAKVIME